MYGTLTVPAPLATLMMRPCRRAIILLTTALQQSIGPLRFTSTFLHHSVESVSHVGPNGPPTPAALTSRVMGPSSSSVIETILRTATSFVTSVGIATLRTLSARNSAMV